MGCVQRKNGISPPFPPKGPFPIRNHRCQARKKYKELIKSNSCTNDSRTMIVLSSPATRPENGNGIVTPNP